jgi:hypothetical protein
VCITVSPPTFGAQGRFTDEVPQLGVAGVVEEIAAFGADLRPSGALLGGHIGLSGAEDCLGVLLGLEDAGDQAVADALNARLTALRGDDDAKKTDEEPDDPDEGSAGVREPVV